VPTDNKEEAKFCLKCGEPLPSKKADAVSSADIPSGSTGKLSIGDLLSKSFEIYKSNLIIIAPSLMIGVWSLIGTQMLLKGGWNMTSMGLFGIVSFLLFLLAAGLTIEMIKDAQAGGTADLSRAWEASKGRLATLLVASILVGIIVAAGLVLLILPGIILLFLLYFVPYAVMLDNKGAKDSLASSYHFVRANLADSVVVIIIAFVINAVLSIIPVIGSIIASPFVITLATLFYINRSK
jgi:hypothetical protein